MKDFKKRNAFSGGGRERDGGGFRKPGFARTNGQSFERTQLYPAVCASCNKACEVPFRPNGQRPVYCKDCFGANREGAPMAQSPRREFRAPAAVSAAPAPRVEDSRINDLRRQMDGINSKLDRLIESVALLNRPKPAVEVPKEEKPVIVKFAGKKPKSVSKAPVKKVVNKKKK